MNLYLEIIAVIFGFLYLILLMREEIICWLFGALSSLLSIVLFYRSGLYSECILYVYYVIIAVYGYVVWDRATKGKEAFKVSDISKKAYASSIVIGALLAFILGFIFKNYTDASAPYLDATTTVFSFIASYFEVNKKLASWRFWIVINAVTIFLYLDKDLNYYTALTVVYLALSFLGYKQWKQQFIEIKN